VHRYGYDKALRPEVAHDGRWRYELWLDSAAKMRYKPYAPLMRRETAWVNNHLGGRHGMAKKALLIGINRYRIPGADLRGCVNDIKNVRAVLTRYYGFARQDITTLADLKATTKAMQSAIQTLIKGGKKARCCCLSRHGPVPDNDGDGPTIVTRSMPHRPGLKSPPR
jgi:hypothetical protein